MNNIKYTEYTKNEFLKILKNDGILFVKTNLGDKYIIKKNDLSDFIILEALRTGHTAEMSFFMPGIERPVITTYGWFLNRTNPVLRKEIINRLCYFKQPIKSLEMSKFLTQKHSTRWLITTKLIMKLKTTIHFIKNMKKHKLSTIRDWRNVKMETNIISVKYEDNYNPKTFGGKAYSYYTNKKVKVGDLVIAPTAYGEKIARVSEINIPEYRIEMIKPYLKTITQKIDKEIYLQTEKIQEKAA